MNDQFQNQQAESYLARFSLRLTSERQFMAHVLEQYCKQESLDNSELAKSLGISSSMYIRLSMCKRPDANRDKFVQQVNQISHFTGCDTVQLAQMINQVDALSTIRQEATAEFGEEYQNKQMASNLGWLAAARDHGEEEQNNVKEANEADNLEP